MGNQKSKNPIALTNKQIRFIQHKTGMKKDDILVFYRDFIANHPTGYISEEEFVQVYTQLYDFGCPERIAKLAFRIFDKEKIGMITFSEFLCATALAGNKERHTSDHFFKGLEHGLDLVERLDNGRMSRKDVEEVMLALYEPDGIDHEKCRRKVDDLMNHHEHVTREAFVRYVVEDEIIKRRYSIFYS